MGLRIIDRQRNEKRRRAEATKLEKLEQEARQWGAAVGLDTSVSREEFKGKLHNLQERLTTFASVDAMATHVEQSIRTCPESVDAQARIDIQTLLDLLE